MRILLLHTGGTIGMEATQEGFAPRHGVVEDAVAQLVAQGAVPKAIDILPFEQLIDSAQVTPEDWHRIARRIWERGAEYDAVVVTHGTDTMAYSAGALCLSLPGLTKPVIVTGAMLPLTVQGTDGWRNLTDALNAATTAGPGVWVHFAGKLLHGGRVRKSHSSKLDAFEAGPSNAAPKIVSEQAGLNVVRTHRIGVFSVTPGVCTPLLYFAAQSCDGILLRCYGSGTAPDTPEMRAALNLAADRGIPVVAVSQCPEGGMKLGTYAAGQVMRETGVVDGRDITPEMAYVKLQFCLSLGLDADQRRAFLNQSQCGEMTL
jgi:L-asparaginase